MAVMASLQREACLQHGPLPVALAVVKTLQKKQLSGNSFQMKDLEVMPKSEARLPS